MDIIMNKHLIINNLVFVLHLFCLFLFLKTQVISAKIKKAAIYLSENCGFL